MYAGICKDDYGIDQQECTRVKEFRIAMPYSLLLSGSIRNLNAY